VVSLNQKRMADRFPRSHQALAADRFGRLAVRLGIAAVILGAWLAWFCLADVAVYARSANARLEAATAAHRAEPQVAAKIVELDLQVGKAVRSGQVLAVLESRAEQLSLAEHEARILSIETQTSAIERQIDAAQRGRGSEADTGAQALEQARALLREAEAEERLAAQEAARARALHADGQLSQAELSRALTEAERKPAQVAAVRREIGRLQADRETRGLDRTVELERLRREHAELAGQLAEEKAASDRLELEIERRVVRAPIDGVVAEVSPVRVGEIARPGDSLGVIVPGGNVNVVASFTAEQSLGRVRAGQRAYFRPAGFPWAQYGTLEATVVEVAGELRDERVRVELALRDAARSRIPLEHGLPGDVEVEIERVTPLVLILRAAGEKLGANTDARGVVAGP
jgi:membrane fusion protein (multidrug efflux system)